MTSPVPYKQWTDDEWLRAMREFRPEDDIRDIEAAVGRWRTEPQEES